MAEGKKGRKIGNKAKKPTAKRRKIGRPEIYRKARNVLRVSGEVELTRWVERTYRADPSAPLSDAARKAKESVKVRT